MGHITLAHMLFVYPLDNRAERKHYLLEGAPDAFAHGQFHDGISYLLDKVPDDKH